MQTIAFLVNCLLGLESWILWLREPTGSLFLDILANQFAVSYSLHPALPGYTFRHSLCSGVNVGHHFFSEFSIYYFRIYGISDDSLI